MSNVIVRNANTSKLHVYYLRLFVVVYKLVNVVSTLEWYCVPVYQVSKSGTLTPYCLRLFVVVYNLVNVVLWYCVPSLIVNTTKL